jgi:hypothetical protein
MGIVSLLYFLCSQPESCFKFFNRYEVAVTPNLSVRTQENLRCVFDKHLHINQHSTGIVGVAVAVDPPALNEVVIAACGAGGRGLSLAVERPGCDAVEVQTTWASGGINNRNAVFCPALGASTFRLIGLKEGVVARVVAAADGSGAALAGSWVAVLANKGSRTLEEHVFSADHMCKSPHWDVCSINDLLAVTKTDAKKADSPAGGAAVSVSCITVKPEDVEFAASALLEIFEGKPSSDEKNLGAALTVYSAVEPGSSNVFLNWGSYWAVYQARGMHKCSFPFDVARGRDNRIAASICAVSALAPKQARIVLTWSPCLPSGMFFIYVFPFSEL